MSKRKSKLSVENKLIIGSRHCPICGRKPKSWPSATAHLSSKHGINDNASRLRLYGLTDTGKHVKHIKPSQHNVKLIRSNKFYSSRAWRELRYEAIVKYGPKCMCCGRTPADGIIIHVDHIEPKIKHPELALDINNLQILCNDCNLGKSYKDSTDWRSRTLHDELNTEYRGICDD